ncbi:MAG: SpoIIE family protein phosphatase [Spirochaetales bacterium]|nr:SpoIIE family protein phosphatase [Spirochaetales bacterium]
MKKEMPGEKILIVEDERLIALELEEILTSAGYLITGVVSSGKKALEKVNENIPDLILMDIRIEGTMDGIKTAQEINKSHNIPVIFISALSDEASLENAKLAEPYSYIVKPFHEKSLIATIKMVLYKSKKVKKIEERETWFTSVMEDLGDAIILCNPLNQILYINLSAKKLLNIKEKEVRGKTVSECFTLLHSQTKSKVKIPDEDDFTIHSNILFEDIILVRPDKTTIPVDLSVTPMRLGPSGFSQFDTSEQKQNFNGKVPEELPEGEEGGVGKVLLLRDIGERKIKQKKIQHEIDTAIEMQRKLLPSYKKPVIGINAGWFLHPCSFGGGDLFHILKIDKDHVGFYILDVMGHGISATITSLMLHRILSPEEEKGGILKINSKKIKPPVEVLAELNRHFYGQQPFQFFTIIYGVMNISTGITTCVRAGHNYPILQDSEGNISEILCEGAAIGLYPELHLTEKKFTLEKGNRLFFYSDGLIECANKEENFFSVQRLYSYIIESKKKPIKKLAKDLEARLFEWRGKNYFNDDVSFMVLERQ